MTELNLELNKNTTGRYGEYGGQYIPETLMNQLDLMTQAYEHYKNDPEFKTELHDLLVDYANRPSLLYYAKRMTEDLGGAQIYLKREDLNHTGAHKINNVIGQALLAKHMGKTRLIAELVLANTVLPPQRLLPCLGWNVKCSWAKKTLTAKN